MADLTPLKQTQNRDQLSRFLRGPGLSDVIAAALGWSPLGPRNFALTQGQRALRDNLR